MTACLPALTAARPLVRRPWQRAPRVAGLAPLLGLLLGLLPQAQAQSDWTACAEEGEVCRFQGEALVRFGLPGQAAFRVARNRVLCDVDEFGDPAPGRRKQCQVSFNWRQDPRYRGWRDPHQANQRDGADGPTWVLCASEGEYCRVPGQVVVRYGANHELVERRVSGGILCGNEAFGDPSPGTAKQCLYALPAAADPSVGPPRPIGWLPCALEGGTCTFNGPGLVRYGADGRHVYRDAMNDQACSNAGFGADPAPDRPKRCQLLRLPER